ncbi:hypothetical protein MWU75_03285 [Ornithinimicrobium sp. F0845]|uniref:DUF6703 family protein n=1 Tax=Ornithinimicrobium sp. F0845 TaxID=2926412 RepID=UPI001FF5F017|nr:DUF6703 family protein [Ornithinimicrobium sp. F0845]MCK0111164.1 hypothetical protein [Ornithinimicrobium sp. F0845]
MSNPIHSADPHYHSTGARAAIERASLPTLRQLAKLPTWLPMLVMAALILVGAFLGGVVGAVLVGVALLALLWLLYLSWPHLTPSLRMMRIAVLVLLLAIVVTQFVSP